MNNIEKIYDDYQKSKFEKSHNEELIVELLLKQKQWSLLDNFQKMEKRKNYLRDFEKYFIYSPKKKEIYYYEMSILEVQIKIMNFILKYDIENKDEMNEYLFRIRNMLFCENELLNQFEKIQQIGHVPYEIFSPLIEKTKDSKEYKEYQLDELFMEYKKMLNLFTKNPYKESK